ncbi:MAG TPA: MFS transporter, partial [Alphaproteobacteria bacterium]|nr:MFS transporter [Alphaproteobacteria bacterium]
MAEGKVINVTELVDRQKFGLFHLKLMVWLFLVLLLDGYDISAASLANPDIIRQWNLQPEDTTYFLTASLAGIMVGAIIFGWFGDRFGRKTTILTAATLFGAATLACALSTNLDQLTLFRFLCGIGIGGVMPNTIALAAEMAPKGVQATLIILMFTGTPTGSSLPGPIAAWVVPHYGWQMIFWIGGLIPLAIVVLLFFVLPESIQ